MADTEHAGPAAPSSGPSRVPAGIVLAVVVLLAVGAGIAWWLDSRSPSGTTGPRAVDAFVAANAQSLDATYKAEGEFTRSMPDGRQLSSGLLVVQRPPDRLQRSLGSAAGVVGGRTVNCAGATDGQWSCAPSATAASAEQRRADQVQAIADYVQGDDPVYAVTDEGGGCFALVRRRTETQATYGSRAEICFDKVTGGVRRLEVEREGGATDVLSATVMSGQVSDADFDLSADGAYDPSSPSGG